LRCLSSGLPIITNTRPPLIEIEKASAVSVFKSNKAAPIRWALADNKLGLRCCNDRSHSITRSSAGCVRFTPGSVQRSDERNCCVIPSLYLLLWAACQAISNVTLRARLEPLVPEVKSLRTSTSRGHQVRCVLKLVWLCEIWSSCPRVGSTWTRRRSWA
jgi:hypothetical protein